MAPDSSPPAPKLTPITATDFASAADRLERLLKVHGIVPHLTSWPSRMIREARDRPSWAEEEEIRDEVVRSNLFRSLQRVQLVSDLVLVVDLLEAAAAAIPRERAAGRLRMLARSDHAATAQATQSTERDLIFELMCAGWMSKIATEVDLVEPPDVVCTYRGARWGVACKAAYGSANRAVKAVKEGVDQLEKSDCSEGAVVVRMTDVFPHGELVPGRSEGMRTIPSFRSEDDLMSHAAGLALPFRDEVSRRAQRGAAFFSRSKKLAAVWFVAHSFANVSTPQGAISAMFPITLYIARHRSALPFLDDFITATRL
jgi:hypothetical protein